MGQTSIPGQMRCSWGGKEYDCRPAGGIGDMIAFETQFGVSSDVLDPEDDTPMQLPWIGFMAWRSMRKSGHVDKAMSFEDFLDDLDWIAAPDAVAAGEVGSGEEGEQGADPSLPPPLPPELSSAPDATPGSS